jgi:hypothetical protein
VNVREVDAMIRAGQLEQARDLVDRLLLVEHMGIGENDCLNLRNAARELREHRMRQHYAKRHEWNAESPVVENWPEKADYEPRVAG